MRLKRVGHERTDGVRSRLQHSLRASRDRMIAGEERSRYGRGGQLGVCYASWRPGTAHGGSARLRGAHGAADVTMGMAVRVVYV